jgi:hypothetical protein
VNLDDFTIGMGDDMRSMIFLSLFVISLGLAKGADAIERLPPCTKMNVDQWNDCRGLKQYPDGTSYEGEFKQGTRHGQGILFNRDAKRVYSGLWANDKFMIPASVDRVREKSEEAISDGSVPENGLKVFDERSLPNQRREHGASSEREGKASELGSAIEIIPVRHRFLNRNRTPNVQRAEMWVSTLRQPDRVSDIYEATVVWQLQNVGSGNNRLVPSAIRGDVDIPNAKLKMSLLFQKNNDNALSASHTITVTFKPQPGSPLGNVKAIGPIQMRRADAQSGEKVAGIPVPITENNFLIGLMRGDREARNIQLLRSLSVIDLPLQFADGRPATINMEKGAAGEQVFKEALSSWGFDKDEQRKEQTALPSASGKEYVSAPMSSQGSSSQVSSDAVESGNNSLPEIGANPKKVKTFTVRPDGSRLDGAGSTPPVVVAGSTLTVAAPHSQILTSREDAGEASSDNHLPPCPPINKGRYDNCFGTIIFPNGEKYAGEFKDNHFNGKGTFSLPDGMKYVGEWKDANWHGQGTITMPDGGRHTGEFKNGKADGKGTRTWIDGRKYVGEFKDNRRNGRGALYTANGQLKESGEYKDDILVLPDIIKRSALVIGNGHYQHEGYLPNPINDAQLISSALKSVGFQVTEIGLDLTREKMIQSIREFAKQADDSDWAVIYYSGHGIEFKGLNYLLPVDAKLSFDRDIPLEAVDMESVVESLNGAKKIKILILDSCRSNPFIAGMHQTVASRSVGRGLAPIEPKLNTMVIYSAKHGQEALDGEGKNSPFAEALAKRIITPGLEIRRLFDYVRDDVLDATQNKQQPFSYISLPGKEDFFFRDESTP